MFSACLTSATTGSLSGFERSIPWISAPMMGESGRMSSPVAMVMGSSSWDPVCPTGQDPLNRAAASWPGVPDMPWQRGSRAGARIGRPGIMELTEADPDSGMARDVGDDR